MTQFTVPWEQPRTVDYGFFGRPIAALARGIYRFAGPIIASMPGAILIGAVIGSCFLVFLHAIVFAYVDVQILGPATAQGLFPSPQTQALAHPTTWGLTPSTIGLLMVQGGGAVAKADGLLRYLFWPLQFGIIRDFVILGAIMGLFNVIPMYTIWWERKVAGRIQSRLGPMRVGGWHGWSQSLADGIKLLLKEDLIPQDADRVLFRLAPYLAIIPSALAFVALPFGTSYVFRELDVALIFTLGVLGIEVVGVILAGWASNNKWSVYGAMREACQMVSYEIPMGMALMIPVVIVGSLNLTKIGDAQSGGWFTWLAFANPFAFVAFVVYYIASLASCKRAPFDLPEAESELVAGFHTEYSGIRWSFFFFAEYAAMFVVSGLATILFMGAWYSPLPLAWGERLGDAMGNGVLAHAAKGILFSGPIWFILKCVFFLYVQIWLRWTLPRIRIDQVLYGCVQVMLPLTMLLLLGTTLWVWASTSASGGWTMFANITNIVLGLVGAVFALMFPAIATYGFYHRRMMVGNLVVDALPGS